MIVILLYNFGIVVLNATFNNISVVWWLSILLVEKNTELHQVAVKLDHLMYQYILPWAKFKLTTLVVMGSGCKSIY